MNVDNKEPYFAFEHRDYDGKTTYTRVTAADRWPDVLEDFVRFLEGLYKYNIKDQILIQKPIWAGLTNSIDLYDPWADHYYVVDEEDEDEETECNEEEETDEDSSHPGLSG